MIDLDEARRIAYDWHGGQGSPLYSFASTGDVANISPEAVREVEDNFPYARQQNALGLDLVPELEKLSAFLVANMPDHPDDED
jgi:hypothetical protein